MPLPFTDLLRSIAAHSNRSDLIPAPKLATTAETGSYGEKVAAAFLRRRGYKVLYRNYDTEHGEIDLICRLGELLVFVEVRTRGSDAFGTPAESIGEIKRNALRYAADRYLELLDRPEISTRFDAVEVLLVPGQVPHCRLQENLFV